MISPFRVLYAENHKANADALEKLVTHELKKLISTPVEFKNVTTLEEAIPWSNKSDATIFDLYLDDAGADEVIASFQFCKEPIIVMTAVQDNALAKRCKDAGATEVFVKTDFDLAKLCQCILQSFENTLPAHAAVEP